MSFVNAPVFSLNGGEVGDEALSRLDLERLQFAGSLYRNVMPRVIGSMTFRPGMEHYADINLGGVFLLEYSYSGASSIVPVLYDQEMRVLVNGEFVTRAAVSTTITNGDFGSFTGWTDSSTGGASATVGTGDLRLLGTPQDTAVASQTISVALADRGVEHALRIDVQRGPVTVELGTSSTTSELIEAVDLEDGVHSIAFTPTTANIYLRLSNKEARRSLVESCNIESPGVMVLPTPWTEDDLAGNIVQYRQNKDVIYVASGIYQQRMIQRRGDTSWGIQRYKVGDGPFVSSDGTIAISPSALVDNGGVTMTSSKPYFESGMVGRLLRLYQSGQTVEDDFSADPAEGATIRVSGVGEDRRFAYNISGTWTGTVRLQVATDDGSGTTPGSWSDLSTHTSNTSNTYKDGDDNVIKYFRFAVGTGDISSGTIETRLAYSGGSGIGIARIVGYNSQTSVDVEILSRFYRTAATFEWDYSTWSDYDGWPAAIDIFGGRLFWFIGDTVDGSVPDLYRSFDDNVEGDSAPISRSLGVTTSRGVITAIGIQRLIAITDSSEFSIKSSSYDDPLTASAWFPTEISTLGGKLVRAVKIDKDGIFVQANGTSAYRLTFMPEVTDYAPFDLMEMHEHICDGSPIVDAFVQRKPEPTYWIILENGEARALTLRPDQNVVAWSRVVTDGLIKRGCASRGSGEDNVYFAVVRDGTQRLEKLAKLTDCRGGLLNCLADGFSRFTATASQTTFPVPQLDGLDVTVWANGAALYDQDNLYTVSGGNVVLPAQSEGVSVVIGLPYTADYKSTKLAYGAQGGTALFHKKKVSDLGLYLLNTAPNKLLAGKDFDTLRSFNSTENGRPLANGEVVASFDADMKEISNDWDTDSRICLRMPSPYPMTVASMVLGVKTNG
jgi:hypothetical protein